MPRAALLLLTIAVTSGCHARAIRIRRDQCDALAARIERDIPRLPAAPPSLAPRFQAEELASGPIHPHGGEHVCRALAPMPVGWTRTETPYPMHGTPIVTLTAPPSPDGTVRVTYTLPPKNALDPLGLWTVRAREILREETRRTADGREDRYLRVAREAGALRLDVLRTHALDASEGWALYCGATLTGEYEALLPLFAAVCDAARMRHWDYFW